MMFNCLIFMVICVGLVNCVCLFLHPNDRGFFSKLTVEEKSLSDVELSEDAVLEVPEFIEKYGYNAESHDIVTEDKYILTIHRINGRKGQTGNKTKPVVLLMHGMTGASSDWVNNGPRYSIGFILSDRGYDVWLGNARGSYYSRKHKTLDPNSSRKYWMFGWHEIGYYDLPAMIDYILDMSEQRTLHFIGHSQGVATFMVMASTKTEYNDKVLTVQALAPVVFMSSENTPLPDDPSKIGTLQLILTILGCNEYLPKTKLMARLAHKHCVEGSKYMKLCIAYLVNDDDLEFVNTTRIPVYLSHSPAGASTRQIFHSAQNIMSDGFIMYDYGFIANLAIYGWVYPPHYKLSRITTPVALYYGDNDATATYENVLKLHNALPNSLGVHKVPRERFGHVSFLVALDAKDVLYEKIIEVMKSFEEH